MFEDNLDTLTVIEIDRKIERMYQKIDRKPRYKNIFKFSYTLLIAAGAQVYPPHITQNMYCIY